MRSSGAGVSALQPRRLAVVVGGWTDGFTQTRSGGKRLRGRVWQPRADKQEQTRTLVASWGLWERALRARVAVQIK